MNIKHINTFDSIGGAAKVAYRLAEEQFRRGHSSGMLAGAKRSSSANFPVHEVFEKQAGEFFPLEREGLQYYSFQMSHQLINNSELRKADLLHLHNIHGGYFNPFSLVLLSTIKPVVWTLHDMHSITGHCAHSLDCDKWEKNCGGCPGLEIYPSIPVDRTARLLKEKKVIYDNSFFNVVAPSYWLKSKLEKSILRNHYAEVIHNGIDSGLFRPLNKKEVRKKYKIPENISIVGCVAHGGIENEWKGGYYITEILKSIVLKYPDTVFLNIGTSGQSQDPHIINIPFVEDEAKLSEIYSLLDVFLFTSIAENCPLVILEALSCGVPIVTFNTGGIPELVRNGLDGYVTGYKNTAEAISSLEVILSEKNKRTEFGNNARESALKHFDHGIIASKYEDVYKKTIEDFEKLKKQKKLPFISLSDIPEEIKTPGFLASYNKTASEAISVSQTYKAGSLGGMKYPKITVVTPSFNQGEFLEETIQSILSQNYPNLEYIIMDGGSTDNSVDIIKKYEKHLHYWQSKPDGGQYNAINAGFAMSSGEILCWLNSDDKLHPGSFELAARIFCAFDHINWISGRHTCWDDEGKLNFVIPEIPDISRKTYYDWALRKGIFIQQESTFWRRSLWEKAGGSLNLSYKLAADFDLWNRFFHLDDLYLVDALLGGFRVHRGQKTSQFMRQYVEEVSQIISGQGDITSKAELIKSDSCRIVTQKMLSEVNINVISEGNFSYFTYSKKDHFSYFRDSDVELYGVSKDPDLSELKVYQDLLCYSFIKTNIPKGSRILEIGGGESRVLRRLAREYECWNIDKLEGLGDGPRSVHNKNIRLVKDYMGSFNKELPGNYFDFVFSISTLEHVPEDEAIFRNICQDIERVMKTGALSLHCFDVAHQGNSVWTNRFLKYIFEAVKTINKFEPLEKILFDPYVYFMSEQSYNSGWRHLTGKSYNDFGKPASYNVLWKKQQPMKENETKISVIVSSYNAEKDMRNCLTDLVAQTVFDQMEVIVVDAASPENEGAVVKEFQKKYKNITYIRTPERIGVYPAWNIAIKKAKGKFITPFSTNDRLRKDAYEILSRTLDENPGVSMVYGDTYITNNENESFEEHQPTGRAMKWPEYSFKRLLVFNGVGPHPMWRASIHQEIGYFSEDFVALGDQEFFLRVGYKHNLLHIKEYTGLYLWRDDAVSLKGSLPLSETIEIRNRYMKMYLQDNKVDLKKPPLVSIIIPTFNKLYLTHRAVLSVQLNTRMPYEIIIVDNCSTDGTREYAQNLSLEFPNVKFVLNNKNEGFAKANNIGVSKAEGRYILCLNNDTEPQAGWMEALLSIAENDESVAAVGSKLLFPHGTIQHAGVIVAEKLNTDIEDEKFMPTHIHYGSKADLPEANFARTYQVLTAASLLIRKDAFIQAGGYDEQYWNGYEDVDLCLKLTSKGWKLVYQPESIVIHYESQSGPERFSKNNENIRLLRLKWMGKIKPDFLISSDNIARPTGNGKIGLYIPPSGNKSLNYTDNAKAKGPFVSIIVLTFNGLKYNKEFFHSVLHFTKCPYEIIVIDNASKDGTVDYLRKLEKKYPNIHVIYNENNLGFPASVNQAFKAATGNFVLVANNDIVVTENWLERMVEIAMSSHEVGIVGPLSNSVSGIQIDKNAKYKSMPEMHKYAKRIRKENAGRFLEFPRVAFLCTLIKKEVIDALGGLDERFSPGNFEDDDFCLRAEKAGFKTVIAKDVFIHHYGSKSFKADGERKYAERLEINKKKFVDKWGATIEEIWLEGKPTRERSLSYPLHTDEFIEKYERALVHFSDGEFELAEGALKRALEIYEAEGRSDRTKEYANILNLYGSLYLMSEDLEKAKEYFERELKIDPDSVSACMGLGEVFLAAELFNESKEMFQWATKNEPENNNAREGLAKVNRKLGLAEGHNSLIAEAQVTLNEAKSSSKLKIVNTDNEMNDLLQRAENLIEQKQLAEAVELLYEIIRTDPGNIDALNDLAVVSILAGDFESAADFIERVVKIDPANDVAMENMNYLSQVIDEKLNQPGNNSDLSLQEDIAENLKPAGQYSEMIGKAEALIENSDLSSARKILETVLLMEEFNLDALNDLSVIEIMEGNYQAAVELLEKVIRLAPDNAVANENILYLQKELDKL
ncbi:MAG TPA: glycosyltransferase [Ignavibacteriales bacterium]|nr:glycosyltransferase [Ignavibacteriales bacterium]